MRHGDGVSEKSPVKGQLIVRMVICAASKEGIRFTTTGVSKPVYMEIGERDQLMKQHLISQR
jgi:hypothetical protein